MSKKIFLILSSIILLLLFSRSKCQEGVHSSIIIDIYETPSCSKTTLVSRWDFYIDAPPYACFRKPFLETGRYEYDVQNDRVNFTYFQATPDWYFEYLCDYSLNITVSFETNVCLYLHSGYYMNITVYEDSPTDYDSLWGWLVTWNYIDSGCQQSSDFFNDYVPSISIFHNSISPDFGCLEGFFHDPPRFGSGWGMNLVPLSLEEHCISLDSDIYDLWRYPEEMGSYTYKCLTEEEMLYLYINPFFSIESVGKYFLQYQSFDSNCSNYYSVKLLSDEDCISGAMVKTSLTRFYLAKFERECTSETITELHISHYSDLDSPFDSCLYRANEREKTTNFSIYEYFEISTEPFITYQVAVFTVLSPDGCWTSPEAVERVLENPGSVGVRYYDEEFCFPIYTADTPTSRKYYCEDGKMVGKEFYISYKCIGPYVKKTVEFYSQTDDYTYNGGCSASSGDYVKYTMCIPRRCGDFSEYDENVCNSNGNCVKKDFCECHGNYEGNLCQTWSCFGVNHDQKPCKHHGSCKAPDDCVCDVGFSGEDCGVNDWSTFGIIMGAISGSTILLFLSFCVLVLCSLYCFCCGIFVIVCVTVSPICLVNVKQKKKLENFQKLDDFDLLLQEQMVEKTEQHAHLKINKKLFEIPYDEINIIELLGVGGSEARVFKVLWKGNNLAMKCFKTREVCSSQENFDSFEKEVNLLASINHPFIVRFYGASLKPPRVGKEERKNISSWNTRILMEFCEKGEILSFLLKYKKEKSSHYPLKEKIRICREISSAGEYIHSRNIIHRDIKSANVLLDDSERCKLMDFGVSRIDDPSAKTKNVGTDYYIAPEVLLGTKYNRKVDIFSFGILLWGIFSESLKPYGENFRGEYFVACEPNYRPDLSLIFCGEGEDVKWVQEIIEKCWSVDPNVRPEFSQLEEIFIAKQK